MQAPTALGIALISSGLALGAAIGCSASETDNTGPSNEGGAVATGVGRGGSTATTDARATGGTSTTALPTSAAGRSSANTTRNTGGRRN